MVVRAKPPTTLVAIMIHHILSSERSIVLNLLTVLKLIIATSAAIMLQPSTGTALPENAPRLLTLILTKKNESEEVPRA